MAKRSKAAAAPKAPSWRAAEALDVLLTQVNAQARGRSKVSDGSIGDPAHASRTSDHNPNTRGVVCARDFTHDPSAGFDSYRFAETLRTKKDPRIKYVISNYRIFSGGGGPSPWEWRKYAGSNSHSLHVHVSVANDPALYDNTAEWDIGQIAFIKDPDAAPITLPKLRVGSKGFYVQMLQHCLRLSEKECDGDFGKQTKAMVEQFQRDHKLTDDGIVAPYSWKELIRPWAEEVELVGRTLPARIA